MSRNSATIAALVAMVSVLAILALAKTTAAFPRAFGTVVIVAGPGLAWVPLLRLTDRALEVLLGVLISVVAVILTAQAVTYAVSFSWRPCEFILVTFTSLGLFVQALVALVHGPEQDDKEMWP